MPHAQSKSRSPSVGPNFTDKRSKVIELNDQLRSSFKGGRVQMTPGVYELDARLRGRALYVMSGYQKYRKTKPQSRHDTLL